MAGNRRGNEPPETRGGNVQESRIRNAVRTENNSGTLSGGVFTPREGGTSTRAFSIKTLRSAVKRWDKLTDENEHTEARMAMAKFFRYNDLVNGFKEVIKEHNKAGYLTDELSERRNRLTNEVLKRVRRDYHSQVISIIW